MSATNVVSIASGGYRERTLARRDALVLAHLSLAAGVAMAIVRGLPPGNWTRKDLTQEAYFGLIRAATSYRPGAHGGAPFACWARLIVRGAVLDAVRARWSNGLHKHGFRPILQPIDQDDRLECAPDAADRIDQARLRARVANAIATLPAEEAMVLQAKYSPAEPNFAEIGARLALSRKRVAKLHASAIARLRRELRAA